MGGVSTSSLPSASLCAHFVHTPTHTPPPPVPCPPNTHTHPTQMGTDKESFIELTERIGRKTGGISVYPFSSAKRGSDTPVSYIMVRGRQHRAVQSAGQGSTCSLQCSSQPYTVLYCTVYSGALQQSAVQACVAGLRVACVPGNTSGKTGNPPRPLHVSHTYLSSSSSSPLPHTPKDPWQVYGSQQRRPV